MLLLPVFTGSAAHRRILVVFLLLLTLVLNGDVLHRDGFCARRRQFPLCGSSSVVCMSECTPRVRIVDYCAGLPNFN